MYHCIKETVSQVTHSQAFGGKNISSSIWKFVVSVFGNTNESVICRSQRMRTHYELDHIYLDIYICAALQLL